MGGEARRCFWDETLLFSTYIRPASTVMKPSLSLCIASVLLAGCATPSAPSSWRWPWQSAATTPAPNPTAATNASSLMSSAIPTEWPDEKRAASDLKTAMAQMLDQQGSVDQAISAYERMLQEDPKNGVFAHRLAVLLDKKGQPDRAEQIYQQALRLTPKSTGLLADYGYHCYLQRRWADAETHLARSLELDSDQSRAHGNLALVLARTQRVNDAVQQFALAGCSPPDAHANVAFALAAESQLEQAEHEYRIALSLDPNHKRSQDALAALGQAQRQAAATPVQGVQPATHLVRGQ